MQFLLICVTVQAVKASAGMMKKTTRVFSNNDQSILDSEESKAILSHDPIGSLPTSFTICSTVMATFMSQDYDAVFYSMWDDENKPFFATIQVLMTSDGINTSFNWGRQWEELEKDGKELRAFPHQWIKYCGAVDLTSGLYQAVVDGIFVENLTLSVEDLSIPIPFDLSGKISLGGAKISGRWWPAKNKVTNLNIFTTAHSVEVMRENTKSGICIKDGDYLAWNNMKWTLHGQAVFETVDAEEPCMEDC